MITAIIQARVGSSRLPSKVLRDLAGFPVLTHIFARVCAIPGIERVCFAVPDSAVNDGLANACAALGATVARGSETDVLSRYLVAARQCDADVVMRVTSDCPLLDPEVSGLVLADFLAHSPGYVSNVMPRSWPKGFDTEVFSRDTLERAAREAWEPDEREHVTVWMRRQQDIALRNVALPDDRFASWRWTLDYEEDLRFMQEVLARLPTLPHLAGFNEIRGIVEAHPEIATINAGLT